MKKHKQQKSISGKMALRRSNYDTNGLVSLGIKLRVLIELMIHVH